MCAICAARAHSPRNFSFPGQSTSLPEHGGELGFRVKDLGFRESLGFRCRLHAEATEATALSDPPVRVEANAFTVDLRRTELRSFRHNI